MHQALHLSSICPWPLNTSATRKVSELSDYFKLNEKRCGKLRLPGADGSNGVGLYTSDGGLARGVGISLVVYSYLGQSGERFHLHPELVDESGDESAVFLCHHCVDKDKPPKMPIASNIDYSRQSRRSKQQLRRQGSTLAPLHTQTLTGRWNSSGPGSCTEVE